jgi:hypothetical protein
VPTSVLLAVLAAAGLLALAPALVRRYDATERLVAERALSSARVLARAGSQRHRRRRTVPGRRPLNPPSATVLASQALAMRSYVTGAAASAASSAASAAGAVQFLAGAAAYVATSATTSKRADRPPASRRSRAAYRRRRLLLILLLLNVAALGSVGLFGPRLWIAVAITGFLLIAFVVQLRNMAVKDQRRRRAEARYAAWLEQRQAAVRREQARRAALRRELLERQLAAREEERRARREQERREAAERSLRGRPYAAGM